MCDRLKRVQTMAQRYNGVAVVKKEGVTRNIPKVRDMTGEQIKAVRMRYKLSPSALARKSVSKWERDESKPNQAALPYPQYH